MGYRVEAPAPVAESVLQTICGCDWAALRRRFCRFRRAFLDGHDWLEKAFDARDPNLPYLGQPSEYDFIRNDGRFQDILRRIRLDSASLARAFPTK